MGVAGGGVAVIWAYMGPCFSVIAMAWGVVVVVACLLSRHGDLRYGIDTSAGPRVSLVMSEQADTTNKEHHMSITYTSAQAVSNASQADAAIGGLWAKAYLSATLDMHMPGANLRDMAQAITATGVKCSKDTAQAYVLAHQLTAHGKVFEDALSAKIGAGKVMRAHSLITQARKERGIEYVRGCLSALSEGDMSEEDTVKAMAKVVKELIAAKKAAKKDPKDPGKDPEDPTDPGKDPEDPTPPAKATATDMLRGLMPLTIALKGAVESGDIPEAIDAWLTEVAGIARTLRDARKVA